MNNIVIKVKFSGPPFTEDETRIISSRLGHNTPKSWTFSIWCDEWSWQVATAQPANNLFSKCDYDCNRGQGIEKEASVRRGCPIRDDQHDQPCLCVCAKGMSVVLGPVRGMLYFKLRGRILFVGWSACWLQLLYLHNCLLTTHTQPSARHCIPTTSSTHPSSGHASCLRTRCWLAADQQVIKMLELRHSTRKKSGGNTTV